MSRSALVCVLIASFNVASGQESLPAGRGHGQKTEHAPYVADGNRIPVLSKVPACNRLFQTTGVTATPDPTGKRLYHLLQAAAHLEAAGRTDDARKIRQQADQERQALLDRLAAVQAEVDRLCQVIAHTPQILVQIRMMELSRAKLRKLGLDFCKVGGKPARLAAIAGGEDQPFAFHVVDKTSPVFAVLKALREDRLLKVVAEPTLMTVSGQPAQVHIGGQCPMRALQSDSSEAIESRDYGTRVDVVAIALDNERVRLEVRPRVSELDPSRRSKIGEHTAPFLRVLEADTRVEMKSGQTLIIGGLVQNHPAEKKTALQKDRDAPQTKTRDDKPPAVTAENELLILITPRIVEPATISSARLPSSRKTAK